MMNVRGNAKSSSISAIVTRADGSVENLGMIAFWHKNPLKRWAVNCFIKIKERINGRSRPE